MLLAKPLGTRKREKKRKLIKAHNKGFENLEHPFPTHDFTDIMMFLARELVTQQSYCRSLVLKRSLLLATHTSTTRNQLYDSSDNKRASKSFIVIGDDK